MNVAFLLIPAFILYAVAHRFYAPFLARLLGEDNSRPTPATIINDGVDYVPTRPHVLFAHHFSAIAAAGPILGPTMAVLYGYVPAFLWVVFGAIFIGAVHDYVALFVSMREGGKSIAQIARKTIGKPAFIFFALFIVFNLVVVNAVFIKTTATSLTSMRFPEELGLPNDQTIFRMGIDHEDGQTKAVVGGIASTSAIALTVIAPLLGFLIIKRKFSEAYGYPIATILCIASVLIGFAYPVSFPEIDLGWIKMDRNQVWVVLISLYVWFAAAAPVWLILQPREFVSVQFLYLGIIVLVAALIGSSIKGIPIQAPAADIAHGELHKGSLWPSLFVTIACGAVSGFHGLVASGTTSKQISRESHAKHVGYLGMLGESALALCVTLTIAVGISFAEYNSFLVKPVGAPVSWTDKPVLAFSVAVAGICEKGLGIPLWMGVVFGLLMVEGFVLDTLDVSIRLNRYLLEEIWADVFKVVPGILKNYWFNSGLAVILMMVLAFSNTAHFLWPIFGTGNQLLASLSLFTMALWLHKQGRRCWFVFIPAVLVSVTTFASLIYLLTNIYWPKRNYLLTTVDLIYLALALGFGALVVRAWFLFKRTARN